jgi:dephospho-CoA kinase
MGAGKTSAAKYLASKYGFQYTRYSKVLQDWLFADGCDKDRLQKLGWDVMAGGLQSELNERLIAGLDRSRSAAIDGLRHPIDFESLLSAFGNSFRMVFLEAPLERRFERLQSRFSTPDAFRAGDSHPVEEHIDGLKPRASMTFSNDNSLRTVYERLDGWIAAYKLGEHK